LYPAHPRGRATTDRWSSSDLTFGDEQLQREGKTYRSRHLQSGGEESGGNRERTVRKEITMLWAEVVPFPHKGDSVRVDKRFSFPSGIHPPGINRARIGEGNTSPTVAQKTAKKESGKSSNQVPRSGEQLRNHRRGRRLSYKGINCKEQRAILGGTTQLPAIL